MQAPIRMGILWCMHCLRTALAEWEEDQTRPFEIKCVMDAKASVSCRQCSGRASTCIPAATAMLGDCQDLSDLLAWAHKTFWLDWVDEGDSDGVAFYDWPYSTETRRVVAEKMMELCKSFDASEQAHRKEHELTGNKAQVKQTRADYNAFLVGRRSALPPVAAPNFFNTREQRVARFSKGLVRLLPGDEGYVLWTLAKRVFFEGISAEVREAQDGLDSDVDDNASLGGDEMEERTMMDFPVPLEEI
ncbi:hypothetical protein N7536_005993 [Penicillium majusculum]|uniref:Uncharacterized protein n=1 Tax=Penicillium solitum TaxID=60172 RepID=A0A1V6PYL2_9EURO|nr:uncharacterized protein PENSOL_c198G06312 [Penicillium solitum]KAJ5686425.1 hypothetical protein N7536_009044 [Penicillium majusculum]KAJ5695581.1 hypothetical protein N7536_005993 [Penicillium majusculum]OQD82033.1 hypothetical protein PENSOL_c198G06312 [Penicillium solitum]